MKKKYLIPEIEIIAPDDPLMWNGAGKEEGVLTTSMEGGTPVIPTPDEDDSDRAKSGSFTWDDYDDQIYEEL